MVALWRSTASSWRLEKGNLIMTTIIIINAASSLLAMAGIGIFLARQKRRTRKAILQPVYVTTRTARPRPRR